MQPDDAAVIAVTGMGVIAPIGVGVDDFAAALRESRPGLRVRDDLAGEPAVLAGTVGDFAPRTKVPARRLRRLSRLSQMAVVAAHEAVADAALAGVPPERIGVVLGTGLGALETTAAFMREYLTLGPAQANPALFPASVMNAAAAHVSMELGFKGYSTTVNHKDASALAAVALAADLLRLGRADVIVCGGVDELSPALVHGYRRFGALTRDRAAVRPFDRRRDGLAPGEGAALFVLEPAAAAAARGARVRARLRGVGLGSGPRRLLSWDGDGGGATAAILAALAEAGVAPAAVDHVVAGANGSPQHDRLEAHVLAAVFGPRPVAVSAILGQTGDFPTAGALRLAAAILALEQQHLPGTLGFGEPDPAAPVPGLVAAPRAAALATALVCAHATGGAEVALLLGRA
ncbi:MAG TPA: beta-ketoacyl synthase N-terminal-like domain-containing protein [Polyangia bacterium]|jgi:3-oxoacyl-[acyl-carrier-protein] synthase II